MEQDTQEQSLVQLYLLGELDSERQQRFEERLMADDEYFEELLLTEDDLIDKYLGGFLSPADKGKFERHFLSTPERRRKLSFAKTLRKYITDTKEEEELPRLTEPIKSSASSTRSPFPPFWVRNPVISLSMSAVLLLIVAGAGWFIIRERRLENQPGRTDSPNVLSVTLVSGATRSDGETKRIVIPSNIDTVRLQLKLNAGNYQSYSAILQTIEGREVLTSDKLKIETASSPESTLYMDVSSKLLSPGDYQLKLNGTQASGGSEEIARYNFRVLKQ